MSGGKPLIVGGGQPIIIGPDGVPVNLQKNEYFIILLLP